jgi:proline iminopeptidase
MLIDSLSYPQVHLLGHSWGALVAAEYALRQPTRVATLILADPVLNRGHRVFPRSNS